MNIAIVEDESAHGRLLRQYIEDWAGTRDKSVHIFLYEKAEAFLFQQEDVDFCVVFADIQMPGMNGMEMVQKLRASGSALPVVFTTGVADYLQEGYEVQALHYLLKPISGEKVADCLDRVCRQREKRELVVVRTAEGNVKLDLQEVNYCEACGHYAEFVLTDGSRVAALCGITELEEELAGGSFAKCHRSYLCNLDNVKQLRPERVVFDNGAEIPVSRRLYRELNQRFIRHYKGKVDCL